MIVVELENIGGLIGRHRFEFKEGLNEIIAPNAIGKTSLIKALLAMYAPKSVPIEQLLNIDADEGYIKVKVNNKVFVRRFKRENGVVVEIESKPVTSDDKIRYVVLDPYLGEVVKRIMINANPEITDYLVRVFRLDEYEEKRKELKDQIESLEKEKGRLEEEVKELKESSEKKKKLEEIRESLKRKLKELEAVSVERIYSIQERIGVLNRRIGEIKARIKDIREKLIPATKGRLKEIQMEIERLKKLIDDFYSHHRDPEKEIKEIRKRIGEIEKYINNLESELNTYISGQDARIPVIKMAKISKSPICPICGRPIEKPEEFWSKREQRVVEEVKKSKEAIICLLYTSPSPRDLSTSRMPSSA